MPENGGNNSGLPDPFDHRPAPFSLQPWAMNSPADTPLGRGPRGPAPRKPAASSGWSDCEKHTSGTRTAAPSITHGSSLQASKIGLLPVALSKALRVAPPRMELVATRPTRFEARLRPGVLRPSRVVRSWLGDLGVKTLFIEPGSPWENGYNESFNGTLRNELLKREIFYAIRSYGLSGLIAFGTIVSPQSSESAWRDFSMPGAHRPKRDSIGRM